MHEPDTLQIFCDGGARGNPGPAACAFVVERRSRIIFRDKKYLGITTNNIAEYNAVVFAFNWLVAGKNFNVAKVVFVLDSELVTRQLTGVYKIKNENLRNLYARIKFLEKKFSRAINYISVPRSKNKIADLLVNQSLDENR